MPTQKWPNELNVTEWKSTICQIMAEFELCPAIGNFQIFVP